MTSPIYTRDILRLAASIPHLAPLDDPHGEAELRSPICGSRMRVSVKLDDEGRVAEVGQQVEACAFGQASAALMGQNVLGRSRDEVVAALNDLAAWLSRTCQDPDAWPGLTALAPARDRTSRHGAMLLPFRTLLAAIDAVETTGVH